MAFIVLAILVLGVLAFLFFGRGSAAAPTSGASVNVTVPTGGGTGASGGAAPTQ